MSRKDRIGATCLVGAPIAGILSVAIGSPVSGKAADQAAAYVQRAAATQIGLGVNALATVLLIAGILWWASTIASRSPRLAAVGGVLGVLGMLAALCDDAMHTAALATVAGMDVPQATAALAPFGSGVPFAVGPASELADIGVIILAIGTVRRGLPTWAAALIAVGVIAEGVGFASGVAAVVMVGFVLSAIGYVLAVRALAAIRPAAAASRTEGNEALTPWASTPPA